MREQAIPSSTPIDAVLSLQSAVWWPGQGGFYVQSEPYELSVSYVDPTTLVITPLDLQGFVPQQGVSVEPTWSATGELFLFVHDVNATSNQVALQVADGKVTQVIPIPPEWQPVGTPALLVGPDMLFVTTNELGPRSMLRVPRPAGL